MTRFVTAFFCLFACVYGYTTGIREAYVINGISCVPVRAVADWLGAHLDYQPAQRVTQIAGEGTKILFHVGTSAASINGKSLNLPCAPFERGNIIFAPVKLFIDGFSLKPIHDVGKQQLALQNRSGKSVIFQQVLLNFDGSELVWVPAGEFTMGSYGTSDILPNEDSPRIGFANEIQCAAEYPAHQVFVEGFWVGRNEITRAQYARFCRAMKRQCPPANTVAEGVGNFPIALITWFDAQAYAKWAGGRLPTEAEWEKAARGLDGREYPWGNWYLGERTTDFLYPPQIPTLLPISTYPAGASPYGVYDMIGNTREWCADWFDATYYRSSSWHNPTGPQQGSERVVRGRSNYQIAEQDELDVRCTSREGVSPSASEKDLGFRIAIPVKTMIVSETSRTTVSTVQIPHPEQLFSRSFPDGYRCVGAWQADLNSDGKAEIAVLATEIPGKSLPPILKILPSLTSQQASFSDTYTFGGNGVDADKWHDVASETSRDGLLPQVLFGIRDVNADGVQEVSVVLRSYGLQSHDEAMFLFQWKGVKQLHLLTKIPFHDATRGGWLMDDASADYPGLEIITVGRQPDPDTLNTALQWYTFTYYAWTGSTYTQFQTCTTVRQYHDAAQAIRSVEW